MLFLPFGGFFIFSFFYDILLRFFRLFRLVDILAFSTTVLVISGCFWYYFVLYCVYYLGAVILINNSVDASTKLRKDLAKFNLDGCNNNLLELFFLKKFSYGGALGKFVRIFSNNFLLFFS